MTIPASALYELESIDGAGRGLIATNFIARGTPILQCDSPAIHVIFREYRKEVCAQCFHYDRGRTLPVRDNDIGKVFCTAACQQEWQQVSGALAIEAWRCLEVFVKAKSKHVQELTLDMLAGPKPDVEAVRSLWADTDRLITGTATGQQAKSVKSTSQAVYPDILALELSAILLHSKDPNIWSSDISALVMDPVPYKSQAELGVTCQSLVQLSTIVPIVLRTSCNSIVSLTAASAGSHNAFGIRAGSDENEEYMGWAIYPNASYFNHSCSPNISKKRSGRTWYFTAAGDILAEQELCISYLGGDERDLSVKERRERLETTWGFVCRCQRCVTEEV